MKPKTLILALALVCLTPLAEAEITEREVFASDKDATDFGYDYREDVSWYGGGAIRPYDDCYEANVDKTDYAYLGKYLAGKRAYSVGLEISAHHEGWTSHFVAAFSLEDVIPSSSSKGNGKTEDAFANSLQVHFKEGDGKWDSWFAEVRNGVSTKLGSSVDVPGANHWESFVFEADTTGRVLRLSSPEGQVFNSATTSQEFQDQALWSQWFVYRAPGNTFFSSDKVRMCLDNNRPSTQVLDLDPHAALISDVDYSPKIVAAHDAITVEATITDDWQDLGAPSAELKYQLNAGSVNSAAMTATGTRYSGEIPGQPDGTEVRFWIEATDVSGLTSRSNTLAILVDSGEEATNEGGQSCPECNTPPASEGATTTEPADSGKVFVYAVLIAAAGVAAAFLFRGLTGNAKLAQLAIVAGVFGALLYGLFAINAGGIKDAFQGLSGGAKAALVLGGVLLVALYLFQPGAKLPPDSNTEKATNAKQSKREDE